MLRLLSLVFSLTSSMVYGTESPVSLLQVRDRGGLVADDCPVCERGAKKNRRGNWKLDGKSCKKCCAATCPQGFEEGEEGKLDKGCQKCCRSCKHGSEDTFKTNGCRKCNPKPCPDFSADQCTDGQGTDKRGCGKCCSSCRHGAEENMTQTNGCPKCKPKPCPEFFADRCTHGIRTDNRSCKKCCPACSRRIKVGKVHKDGCQKCCPSCKKGIQQDKFSKNGCEKCNRR